jgi:thiol-disulfide isomerase/thioredoxin
MRIPSLASVTFVAALLVGIASAPPASAGRGTDFTGQAPPELTLSDGLNGASLATTMASLKGRVVCLKFWLTGCPVCRGTLPEFQAIHDRYGKSGLVCLGVVIDDAKGVGPYLREAGWTFQVGCDPDGRNASRYGVKGYPADYVIGADGVVRASNGFPRETIDDEMRKLRIAELGTVPAGAEGVRDAVAVNDYGLALRTAESLAKGAGASADLKAFAERVTALAQRRQDVRFARADAMAAAGRRADAKAELERTLADFQGTSLEARAKAKLDALGP